jgi:hypothetical protein
MYIINHAGGHFVVNFYHAGPNASSTPTHSMSDLGQHVPSTPIPLDTSATSDLDSFLHMDTFNQSASMILTLNHKYKDKLKSPRRLTLPASPSLQLTILSPRTSPIQWLEGTPSFHPEIPMPTEKFYKPRPRRMNATDATDAIFGATRVGMEVCMILRVNSHSK